MSYDHAKQKVLNQKHLDDPKVGDYWHEMFCPYFIITEVRALDITVLDKTIGLPENRFTFDETKPRIIKRSDLAKEVQYSTSDEFMADVMIGEAEKGEQDFERHIELTMSAG